MVRLIIYMERSEKMTLGHEYNIYLQNLTSINNKNTLMYENYCLTAH